MFDPSDGELTLPATGGIAAPVSCTVTNQTAHSSLVVKQVGGATAAPSTGWTLSAENADTDFDYTLNNATQANEVLPSQYTLSASVPSGLTLIDIQKLDTSVASCLQVADAPTTAAESCWSSLGSANVTDTAAQGVPSVYRVVALRPADMPALPLTGGIGSYLFMIGGGGVLALGALLALLWWRSRLLPDTEVR